MHKFDAIVGRYGSGKTELSLNLAIQASKRGLRTALTDLDLVNPYFTSGLNRKRLLLAGVDVFASPPTGEVVELPDNVFSAFASKYDYSVFDIGGDPTGARVLGSIKNRILDVYDSFRLLYVVNCRRPMSSSTEEIITAIEKIEKAAGLRVTGLINNSNIGALTDASVLAEGEKILVQVSEKTGLSILHYVATEKVCCEMKEQHLVLHGTPIVINLENRPEWIDRTAICRGERRCSAHN